MPYNYLINQNNFQVFNIELQNSVLIFDEGHNILSVSEEGASISISVEQLTGAENELKLLRDKILDNFEDPNKFRQEKNKKLQAKLKNVSEIDTQQLRTSKQDIADILGPLEAFKEYLIQQGKSRQTQST